MSNLLSQGGFGCVYYPGITCNGKINTNQSVITKLQNNDFNASNAAAEANFSSFTLHGLQKFIFINITIINTNKFNFYLINAK